MEDLNEATAQSGRRDEYETPKITNFDPDEDGFELGIEKASMLHKNSNILQFWLVARIVQES